MTERHELNNFSATPNQCQKHKPSDGEREMMVLSGTGLRVKLDPIKTAGTRWERIHKPCI